MYIHDLSNPFIKSISMDDLPEGAWQYITGKSADSDVLEKYYQSIPWMFRGVDIRSNAVASMPFSIYRGENEVDNSEDYQNAVKFLPNPGALFGLVEASLTIWGYAYNFKLKSAFLQKGIRYLDPRSIQATINEDTGEIKFTRTVGGKPTSYTTSDIIYYWQRDPFVEIGPPSSSAARAAASAAGVLLNVDEFAAAFFKRGAVKTTLLTTKNIQPAERDRLKAWWKRVLGVEKAWTTEIVNAEAVTPVVIGEGLESLQNNELTESKRIDIAAALGIPYSVLFSNASNRATAEQDDLHLYSKTVIPECRFIQEVLNDQLFTPLGYKLVFTPENLDVFQEDENERAQSLGALITALSSPAEFLLAADILGYELNPDTQKKIEAMIAEKAKRAEEIQANMAAAPPAAPEAQTPPVNEPEPAPDMRSIDLEKWQTKALKRIKAGRGMDFTFASNHIDPVIIASIGGALEGATSEAEVKAVFASAWLGYP